MHEWPFGPNQATAGTAEIRLRAGTPLPSSRCSSRAPARYRTKKDGWTIATDGRRAAHVEHTIAVTDDGAHPLTIR